ncbi:MAG TPA: PTS sugar transporter subunit IIA [Gemmataceae bacterium]|nr:PTS sugar transporter subunit IIA [Gemmataceae bacterium]
MGNETMDLEELANYLQRDKREVSKMVNRGYLPGRKIGGEWRFARAEINYWIETQLPDYTAKQLEDLETREVPLEKRGTLLAGYLHPNQMAVPLLASTRASVFKELVNLADQTGNVYDPEAILEAIRQREEMGTTALVNGVAIPHPRRPLPQALGETVVAYGRTTSGIPFGAPHGGLTDIFFLVCCRDEKTHMRILARLSRLLLLRDFVNDLRSAESSPETWAVIEKAEKEMIA